MMNYKIKEVNKEEFEVLETQTNQTVKKFNTYQEAKKFLRHLNLGGGFDGWTPTFVLKKFSIVS